MKLYHIILESTAPYFVEASGLGEAVQLWRAKVLLEGDIEDVDIEPDSVVKLSDDPVIRAETLHG